MVKFRPLKEREFTGFISDYCSLYAARQVEAGYWDSQRAQNWLTQSWADLLPQGLNTPGHYFFRILNIQEIPVGYLWVITRAEDNHSVLYINDLVITPEWRGRGYACSALKQLEHWCRDTRIGHIRLFIHPQNLPARSLYQRCGYLPRHREPGFMVKTII